MPKPYEKYVLNNGLAVAAIYELHPFRNVAIKEAVKNNKEIIGQINQILQKMKADGRLKTLSQKYFKANLLCK